MSHRPQPILGMRRRERSDGSPFLVAVLDEQLVLKPGSELHLVRVADEGVDGPTHALRVFDPRVAPSRRDVDRAAADRLDGTAIRRDRRDTGEVMP